MDKWRCILGVHNSRHGIDTGIITHTSTVHGCGGEVTTVSVPAEYMPFYSAPVTVFSDKHPLPPHTTTTLVDDDQEPCAVCYMNTRNLRFTPCGHTSICSACYVKLMCNKCPMCRTNIAAIEIV